MRYALILALAAVVTAPAQSIVNPLRLRGAIAQLDTPQPNEQALRCDVSPIKPSLNFSFRYQAGYTVAVPMNQYLGSGHGWSMLTRITPEGGDAQAGLSAVADSAAAGAEDQCGIDGRRGLPAGAGRV